MSILPKPRHTHVDAVSDKEIARAIINNQGLMYLAADEINMCYTWMLTRIKQSEYLQAIKEACKELRIDKAERQLSAMVDSGNFPAVALTLRTLGRSRGYAETTTAVQPADVMKAFDATMSIWGQKQLEVQQEAQVSQSNDLNSDDISINSNL